MARRVRPAAELTPEPELDLELDPLEVLANERAAAEVQLERYYRDLLARPATTAWDTGEWKPVLLGPTWNRELLDPDDPESPQRWILPEHTLGWRFLTWTSAHLRIDGEPIRWTAEQARWALWWFSLDPADRENPRWVWSDGTLQRLKGWGKDPVASALAIFEMAGPAKPTRICAGLPGHEKCLGGVESTLVLNPWVDIAAVTQHQTKTTMRLLPQMLAEDQTRELLRIGEPGALTCRARAGTAFIQAVTSNPSALEGNRATLVIIQEPHHWKESNAGHDMDAVLRRNTTKAKGGGARRIRFTNAYQPGEDSVAERMRESWLAGKARRHMYDSLEAPKEATLDVEVATQIVEIVKGDSWWLSSVDIIEAIEEEHDPPSQLRRFWYNQVEGIEDTWIDFAAWRDIHDPGIQLVPGDAILVFFDGSKSDDTTGLVACRLSDGAVFVLGLWARPRGARRTWRVPRHDVDAVMLETVDTYDVWGIWGDPSDAQDDDTGASYWMPLLDIWHERWVDDLVLPASDTGHAITWDMRPHHHQREFTAAAQQCVDDIERAAFRHPGDRRLTEHVLNARKRPGRYGTSLGKRTASDRRKVDLAVCMVGARMMRRHALTLRKTKPRRGGRVAGTG